MNYLYQKCFKYEKNLEYTKTIVTNKIYSSNEIKKTNKAGINIIILSKKDVKLKWPIILEKDVAKNKLTKNSIIKTSNLNILDNKTDYYYDLDDNNAIEMINHSRGQHDNFIRTIKFDITITMILIIPYIFFHIIGFPISYKLSFAILIKIIMTIIDMFLYPNLPYDTDIMDRSIKPKEILIGKEELSLSIFQAFLIIFALTIPYMYLLASGATVQLVNTIFLIGFIYSIIFLTIINMSEKMFIINFIQALKNIKTLIFILLNIALTIFIYYVPIFNTKQISIQNYISTIMIVLIFTILFDITKFARFTTLKRSNKNGNKSNKKHRRS